MCNMSSTFDGVDGIHKTYLAEVAIRQAKGHFPTIAALLIDQLAASLSGALQKEAHVILEAPDGKLLPI
eukprot:Skav200086  [mRNA]  locus=scaffold694:34640:40746:+ [translate_table: standard]